MIHRAVRETLNCNYNTGVGVVTVTDHLLYFRIVHKEVGKSTPKYIKAQMFKNFNLKKYLEDLNNVPWLTIEIFHSINDRWQILKGPK